MANFFKIDTTTGVASSGSATAADVGAVPTTRTVNGQALSANVSVGLALYGDKALGTETLSANTTATTDLYYNELTTGAYTLNMNGFKLFASKVTVSAGGKIHCDGNDASGATAGAVQTAGTIGGIQGVGAAGGDGSWASGNAGATRTESYGGNGGSGGRGSIAMGGGSGGTATAPSASYGTIHTFPNYFNCNLTTQNMMYALQGGGGGGGGGGSGGQGGGGGGGGGILPIFAKEIINNGVISANGGAGANGTAANSGGGGGGGGGLVILVYNSYSGTGTITVDGGAKGLLNGGGDVQDGVDGGPGTIIQIQN